MKDLNSDQLRKQHQFNAHQIENLVARNKSIADELAARGLAIVPMRDIKPEAGPVKEISQRYILDDEPKPLTVDELKAGGWSCTDASEDCRLALANKGISVWGGAWFSGRFMYCIMPGTIAFRSDELSGRLKQIHRIGNSFYWGAKKA